MLAAEQVHICRSNLLTLSKLLEKVDSNLTEILCWLGPAAAQADLLSESISTPLWQATEQTTLKVVRRLVKVAIRQYNTLASPPPTP